VFPPTERAFRIDGVGKDVVCHFLCGGFVCVGHVGTQIPIHPSVSFFIGPDRFLSFPLLFFFPMRGPGISDVPVIFLPKCFIESFIRFGFLLWFGGRFIDRLGNLGSWGEYFAVEIGFFTPRIFFGNYI